MKKNNKKGFTLIELLVVISILGTLVLLAAPRLIGFTHEAEKARIVNDIRVIQDDLLAQKMNNPNLKGAGVSLSSPVYNKRGEKVNISGSDTFYVPNSVIENTRTALDGIFLYDENNNVYYSKESENIVEEDRETLLGGDFSKVRRALGLVGHIIPDNVSTSENSKMIEINIPSRTNTSGQVMSDNFYTYGRFSSEIMIPDNDGLLSGFFLYGYDNTTGQSYEIDIEFKNVDGKWVLMNTIFNPTHENYSEFRQGIINDFGEQNPGEVFKKEIELDFDPTESYNLYEMEVRENYIAFYANGERTALWEETFDMYEMRLFGGTFYTHWLNWDKRQLVPDADITNIRNNNFEAYDIDNTLQERMNNIFGRENDYSMKMRNIVAPRKQLKNEESVSYLASDEDFNWIVTNDPDYSYSVSSQNGIGYYMYVGNETIVEIPERINGDLITNYHSMFEANQTVEKVISKNNVTSTSYMFYGINTEKLDLSEFNSSSLNNSEGMFMDASIEMLDISFDFSNVSHYPVMFLGLSNNQKIIVRDNNNLNILSGSTGENFNFIIK